MNHTAEIFGPLPDASEVLRACEQCCAQWQAFKRAGGQPLSGKAPQSLMELVMELSGCDAWAALSELMQAQRVGLVNMPDDGLGEPVITDEGRQFLAMVRDAELQEERRRRKAAARGLNYAGWAWGSKQGWRTEDDEICVHERWEARKGRMRLERDTAMVLVGRSAGRL